MNKKDEIKKIQKDEIRKILNFIIPKEMRNSYIELIKLIELYNLKYYYLTIKNREQDELLSIINGEYLNKMKKLLVYTEREFETQRESVLVNKDFGHSNLLINKLDNLKKIIFIEEQKIDNWHFKENEINEILKDISVIVDNIELKLKEIFSLNLFENSTMTDDSYDEKRYGEMINNIKDFSFEERLTLFKVIKSHIEMFKNAFKVAEEIALNVISAYQERKLIDVDVFNFLVVYSSTRLCTEGYEVMLDSIFNYSSEEEFKKCNRLNTAIVKEVSNYLSSGLVSNNFLDNLEDISFTDRHYVWMYSCMIKNHHKKSNFVKQRSL